MLNQPWPLTAHLPRPTSRGGSLLSAVCRSPGVSQMVFTIVRTRMSGGPVSTRRLAAVSKRFMAAVSSTPDEEIRSAWDDVVRCENVGEGPNATVRE